MVQRGCSTLGLRANRIAQTESASRGSASSQTRFYRLATLSTEERMELWVRLMYRALAAVGVAIEVNRAILMIGRDAVRQIVSPIIADPSSEESQEAETSARIVPPHVRLVRYNNQLWSVGRRLKSGQGAKDAQNVTRDPLVCQYPTDKIKARGNGKQIAWYCQACAS